MYLPPLYWITYAKRRLLGNTLLINQPPPLRLLPLYLLKILKFTTYSNRNIECQKLKLSWVDQSTNPPTHSTNHHHLDKSCYKSNWLDIPPFHLCDHFYCIYLFVCCDTHSFPVSWSHLTTHSLAHMASQSTTTTVHSLADCIVHLPTNQPTNEPTKLLHNSSWYCNNPPLQMYRYLQFIW